MRLAPDARPSAHPPTPMPTPPLVTDRGALVALALGANLGDRAEAIHEALLALDTSAGVAVLRASTLHETAPVGGPANQPVFLNAAALLRVALEPRALLERCQSIERSLGRDRASEVPWGPRTLDLDLLIYADRTIDEPGLTIPHPRLAERRFVLAPLAEIAPDLPIPRADSGTSASARALLEALA